jgi:DNA-binding NarL/FixJ family response regulator
VAECAGRAAAKATIYGQEPGFDLILLDLILDDGDGFELIRFCRAHPRPPRLVAISDKGNPSSDYLYCALECGADLALSKKEPDLATAVAALLEGDAAAVDDLKRRKRPRRTPMVWPLRLLRSFS